MGDLGLEREMKEETDGEPSKHGEVDMTTEIIYGWGNQGSSTGDLMNEACASSFLLDRCV